MLPKAVARSGNGICQKLADGAVVALASGFFLSFLPSRLIRRSRLTGAGLIGSLIGMAIVPCLPQAPIAAVIVWLGALLMAVPIADRAEELLGRHDDPRIIIDEIIGYWTAVLWLPHTKGILIAALILFRLFDVSKVGGILRTAKWPGGWGVVMDDVAAGVYAMLLLHIVHAARWL